MTDQFRSSCYYVNLGLTRSASADEIKRAYRKLSLQWHPDKNRDPHAELNFKVISEAYQVLSDPQARLNYDTYGKEGQNGRSTRRANETHPYQGFGFSFQTPDQLFRHFFQDDPFFASVGRPLGSDLFAQDFFAPRHSFFSPFEDDFMSMSSSSTSTSTVRVNGRTITKKVVTKTLPNGQRETITEEFVDGRRTGQEQRIHGRFLSER